MNNNEIYNSMKETAGKVGDHFREIFLGEEVRYTDPAIIASFLAGAVVWKYTNIYPALIVGLTVFLAGREFEYLLKRNDKEF